MANAQNITDSFNYVVNASIGNYSGWSVSSGNALVVNQYVHSASRSLRLVGGLQTEVRRELGGASGASVLYVDLWIRPVVYDGTFETAILLDGSLVGFTKEGAEGRIWFCHGETPEGTANWVDSGYRFWMNRDGCTASDWLRIGIRQDSINENWDLYVDGKMFAGSIAFKNRGVESGYLILMGGDLPADVYVDDLKIWTSNPLFADADLDGMDDAFETNHSFNTMTNDRENDSAEPGVSRIQYYLNETHNWFVGQWAATTADTDMDGMPDQWELFFGLDPNDITDGDRDSDGDGVSNAKEYHLGTSPVGNFVVKDVGEIMSTHGTNGRMFQPYGINNAGDIIGYYPESSSTRRYVVLHPSGSIHVVFTTTENSVPRSLLAINDLGLVVGHYKPLTPDNASLFWWNGNGLQSAGLPETGTQITSSPLGISIDLEAGDMDPGYYTWNEGSSVFNDISNEFESTFTLDGPGEGLLVDSDTHYDIDLVETKTLSFNSSFIGLSNLGKVVGAYTSNFAHYFDVEPPFGGFEMYISAERRTSSGFYGLQLPVGGNALTYSQFPQNVWSGTEYRPLEVNCAGEILGTMKVYEDGNAPFSPSGAYVETFDGMKTILEHPNGLPLTPLKLNRFGHALLKVTGSSPPEYGLAKGQEWVPLSYSLPSGASFVPKGIDDSDVVVGHVNASGFGPALLSDKGLMRLANAAPEGGGWRFNQATIVAVSDSGLILGTAPMLGHSGPQRCFVMWRFDDQDGDGLPDDWERQIVAADTSGFLVSIWDVQPGDDQDADGLNNRDEHRNGTDPTESDGTLFEQVGLTVFTLLE
ncbi:hypothetical protein EI77_01919 [Prosthecobacter fusiformis]|uniref:Uncharacterized protein n=2 Tax=Prosthecobacter fusiformis TaxID=48464 RepID=A0A4R7S772_9BACT|nr:hypothetical protein EI77_01919 [Prosthecobacter fusiformis]